MTVCVVIPALDEAETITHAIRRLPIPPENVTVVDNGSSDGTAWLARCAGARVITVSPPGYGRACHAGAAMAAGDIIVFMDADLSEAPEDLMRLVAPIAAGDADMVLGERIGGWRPWHADLGTRFCVSLINRWWGTSYRDLGPFRAIRAESLRVLDMHDRTWGWTIEMQVRAAEAGLRWREIPVESGARAGGRSKISGSIVGSARAALRMLETIVRLRLTRRRRTMSAT